MTVVAGIVRCTKKVLHYVLYIEYLNSSILRAPQVVAGIVKRINKDAALTNVEA